VRILNFKDRAEANGSNEHATGNPLIDAAFNRLQARTDARFQALADAMTVTGISGKEIQRTDKRA
jgi:hypothetical protein